MSECVLCDWQMDWMGEPIGVYLPGEATPLRWYPDGPAPAKWTDSLGETIGDVAVIAHWANEHPLQLRLALGRRDWQLRHVGDPPPYPPGDTGSDSLAVDTVYAVDLAGGGKKPTIVKATKLWIAKAFGVPPDMLTLGPEPPENPQDGHVWIDAGPLKGPMTIEYLE